MTNMQYIEAREQIVDLLQRGYAKPVITEFIALRYPASRITIKRLTSLIVNSLRKNAQDGQNQAQG